MAFTPNDLSFRQLITGAAPASSLVGFVVLINEDSVDPTFWDTVADGGGDIRASLDSDGNNQLPVEVVLCNTTTKKLIAWARFPTYSIAARGLHFVALGEGQTQPSVTDTFGRNAVWADFDAVYHGNNLADSSGNLSDLNATNGASSGYPSASINGYGFTLNRLSNQYFSVPITRNTANSTLSAWINPTSDSNDGQGIVSLEDTNALNGWFRLTLQDNISGNPFRAQLTKGGGGGLIDFESASYGVNSKVDSTFDVASSQLRGYLNAIESTGSANTNLTTINILNIGAWKAVDGYIQHFGGVISDIRVRNPVSANHIASEYSNQSAPATFWTQSTPDNPSGGGSTGAEISPTSITSLEAFGTQVITTGLITLSPSGISSLEVFGTASLSTGASLSPSSISTLESFGTPVLSAGGVPVSPNGIISLEAFGTATVEGILVTVSPSSIASLESFGEVVLERLLSILLPTGIVTRESFGRPLVVGGDTLLIPVTSRVTWNAIAAYLRTVGFKGSDNDVIVAWLRSEGFVDGAYNDLWVGYLEALNYVGTLTDAYAEWKRGD